jgi:hypothetical protein
MNKLVIALSTGCMLIAVGAASAQENNGASLRRDGAPTLTTPTLTTPSVTPEMWLYEQERLRYESSAAAVRRNAEFASMQRRLRIESRKWYGQSVSRPIASPTPFTDVYSPGWASNTLNPYVWTPYSVPAVAVRGWNSPYGF